MEAVKYLENIGFQFSSSGVECATALHNQSVGNRCTDTGGHRFPDVQMISNGFLLVIEIDENSHRGAAYSCDIKRMFEIAASVGMPTYFIRYNPNSPASSLEALGARILDLRTKHVSDIQWIKNSIQAEYMFYHATAQREAFEQLSALE